MFVLLNDGLQEEETGLVDAVFPRPDLKTIFSPARGELASSEDSVGEFVWHDSSVESGLVLVRETQLTHGVSARRWQYASASPLVSAHASVHDDVEVAFIESGTLRYRIGTRTFVANAGDIVVVPAHVAHQTDVLAPLAGGAVKISNAVFDDVSAALNERIRWAPLAFASARATSVARLMTGDGAASPDSERLFQASLTDALIALVVDAFHIGETKSRDGVVVSVSDVRVRAVLEAIHDGFRDTITVDDLARHAGVSRFHLSRMFKQATGKSPYQYLLDVRLVEAARLLRGRAIPVSTAALDAGFTDLSRFHAAFKRSFGVPPGAYASSRRSAQGANDADTRATSAASMSPSSSRS